MGYECNLGDGEGLHVLCHCGLHIVDQIKCMYILRQELITMKEIQSFYSTNVYYFFSQSSEKVRDIRRKCRGEGDKKQVRVSERSSYRGFELSRVCYEQLLRKVQREISSRS